MSKRLQHILQFVGILVAVLVTYTVGQWAHVRIDMTEDQRFSLNSTTRDLARNVQDPMLFTVYLEGDMSPHFQRLRAETRRMLEEFSAVNRQIQFHFEDPSASEDAGVRRDVYTQLRNKGLYSIQDQDEDGGSLSIHEIFPGMVVSYKGREHALNLLAMEFSKRPEDLITPSIQNLEFNLATAIRNLTTEIVQRIGIVDGHAELAPVQTASLANELFKNYHVERFDFREFPVDSLTDQPSLEMQVLRMNTFDMLIIAKPMESFEDLDRWLLDQYLMRNGRVVMAVDMVPATVDSLSQRESFLAVANPALQGLSQQVFNYGARINTDLVRDMSCSDLPTNVHGDARPWSYFPIAMPRADDPISGNLSRPVRLLFPSSIDLIKTPGVTQRILLTSSRQSYVQATPGMVSLRTLYTQLNPALHTDSSQVFAVLLEGALPSYYANRFTPMSESMRLPNAAKDAKLFIVSDGDFVRNQLNRIVPRIPAGEPLPLGFDQFTKRSYGNQDFMMNVIDVMLDQNWLVDIRGREVTERLLDPVKVNDHGMWLRYANLFGPMIIALIWTWLYQRIQKRRYA